MYIPIELQSVDVADHKLSPLQGCSITIHDSRDFRATFFYFWDRIPDHGTDVAQLTDSSNPRRAKPTLLLRFLVVLSFHGWHAAGRLPVYYVPMYI